MSTASTVRSRLHMLPLFAEKLRSCRVVQERRLVQHEQGASMKITLHELTRALYVIATRRLCYDELNARPLGWRFDENQLNIIFFIKDFFIKEQAAHRDLGDFMDI